jgi:hypothetical protein
MEATIVPMISLYWINILSKLLINIIVERLNLLEVISVTFLVKPSHLT